MPVTKDQLQKARDKQRAEIVSLLRELRDELTDASEWTPKRGVWNMAILAAEGRFDKKRKKVGETTSEENHDRLGDPLGSDADGLRNS